MTYTIFYPLTITLILGDLNGVFLYSIIRLSSTTFPNITTGNCNNIPFFLFPIFITSKILTFSLLPNCNICSEHVLKIFQFVSPLLYYISFIALIIQMYLNIDCISQFQDSTDQNMLIFFNVLTWNLMTFALVFHFMLLSFLISIVRNYFTNKNNKYNQLLPINESQTLIFNE